MTPVREGIVSGKEPKRPPARFTEEKLRRLSVAAAKLLNRVKQQIFSGALDLTDHAPVVQAVRETVLPETGVLAKLPSTTGDLKTGLFSLFGGFRQTLGAKEHCKVNTQEIRQLAGVVDSNVGDASFYLTDVGPMEARLDCEVFLRQAGSKPRCSQICGES